MQDHVGTAGCGNKQLFAKLKVNVCLFLLPPSGQKSVIAGLIIFHLENTSNTTKGVLSQCVFVL